MKLFKKYVEVEQTMTKKESKVLMLDSSNDADKYDITQKVVQVGPECVNVKEGDIPIMAPHFQEFGRQWVSGEKDAPTIVWRVIYNEDDIVGVE